MTKIYRNQFYLLGFISVITFKVAMLPSHLYNSSGSASIFSMLIMMVIELFMLAIIYGVVSKTSLIEMQIPKAIKTILLLLIFSSLLLKLGVFAVEGLDYVVKNVFEDAPFIYVVLPTILLVVYVASKGMTNIARTSEILFWVLAFAFVFNLLFATLDININHIKKITFDETVAVGADKYFVWFGDFTPFLLARIIQPKKNSPFTIVAIIALLISPVILMLGFVGIYGPAGGLVDNAFSKLAVYNRFTFMVGSFGIPTIIAFLFCMILKLSIIMYALIEIVCYFFKKTVYVLGFFAIIIVLFIIFVMRDSEISVAIATSGIRYYVMAVEYGVPMVAYILVRLIDKNKKVEMIHA